MILTIEKFDHLPQDIIQLVDASEKEGFVFVRRFVDEWVSGENIFDKPGEFIVGAYDANSIIGICGVNKDPYTALSGVARLRHLYVDIDYRDNGIGRQLVRYCLRKASMYFQTIRLRSASSNTDQFYKSAGFKLVSESTATHKMRLVD